MVHDSLCRSNILKTNDEELTVVSRMFGIQAQCRDLLEKYGLRTVILTCGAVGSHVFTPDGMSYVATPHVEVADGVGAGIRSRRRSERNRRRSVDRRLF